MLQAFETLQKRIEDTKKASDEDPYIDAYAIQNKLIQELIDLLKSNTDSLIDVQLIHWIDRQEHAGSEIATKLQNKNTIEELDNILKENNIPQGQMSIDELLESTPNKDETINYHIIKEEVK